MRLITNGFHYSRFHRAVNFYLSKAVFFITVNSLYGLFFGSRLDNTQCIWAFSINNTGFYYFRAYSPVMIDGIFNGVDKTKLVPAITSSGYPCRKICRAPLCLFKMGVHVPQAWQ